MDIRYRVENNVLYVMMIGELDEYSASHTRNLLDEIINQKNYDNVVFDMSSLNFMDSTGIGVLIGRYKILKQKNKDVFISNPTRSVEKIFNMSGIFEIMPKIS